MICVASFRILGIFLVFRFRQTDMYFSVANRFFASRNLPTSTASNPNLHSHATKNHLNNPNQVQKIMHQQQQQQHQPQNQASFPQTSQNSQNAYNAQHAQNAVYMLQNGQNNGLNRFNHAQAGIQTQNTRYLPQNSQNIPPAKNLQPQNSNAQNPTIQNSAHHNLPQNFVKKSSLPTTSGVQIHTNPMAMGQVEAGILHHRSSMDQCNGFIDSSPQGGLENLVIRSGKLSLNAMNSYESFDADGGPSPPTTASSIPHSESIINQLQPMQMNNGNKFGFGRNNNNNNYSNQQVHNSSNNSNNNNIRQRQNVKADEGNKSNPDTQQFSCYRMVKSGGSIEIWPLLESLKTPPPPKRPKMS